jgi:adenylosuccinate lyase
VRAMALPAMEDVALWHERDISHSSVERVIAPDATIALDFSLARLAELIDRLVVYPERMKANLERLGGIIHSQRVLLALTEKGMSREAAYAAVQRNAMRAWSEHGDFLALLKQDPEIRARLNESELEGLFELAYHLKNVDRLFSRVFGDVQP